MEKKDKYVSMLFKAVLPALMASVFILQSCFHMRVKDSRARNDFKQKSIDIYFGSISGPTGTIHYAKTGNDTLPTLFFIHGSPGSWWAFKKYMQDSDLLNKFRIISIDRPGFGYSNFRKAMRLQYQAPLIYNVVKAEKNNKPVHLVGHSIGGPVVVKLGQEYPQQFSSLTILAGSISPQLEPKERWRKIAFCFPFKFLLPGAFRPSNKEIIYFKKDLYQLDTAYDQLKMPVAFIHGDKDPRVTVKNVEYGLNKLSFNPNTKVVIIPGANHFIPWLHFNEIKTHLLTLPVY